MVTSRHVGLFELTCMVEPHSSHVEPFAVGPGADLYNLLWPPLVSLSTTRPNGWIVGDWQYPHVYTVPMRLCHAVSRAIRYTHIPDNSPRDLFDLVRLGIDADEESHIKVDRERE
jgi:hypothetical protein